MAATAEDLAVRRASKFLQTENPFGEYMMLPTNTLTSDSAYQRSVSVERVEHMVRNFDPLMFQTLFIARRRNLKIVVDGQHRLLLAKTLKIEEVPCIVFASSGVAEEAKRFVLLQEKRRTLLSIHKFGAKLVYEDAGAIELSRAFKKYKFQLPNPNVFSTAPADDVIRCLGSFERIFRQGGRERVDWILYIIRSAWNGSSDSLSKTMVQGLGRLAETTNYTESAVARKLKDHDPFTLQANARTLSHRNEIPQLEAMSMVLQKQIER